MPPDEHPLPFSQAILEHLELRRRNAALEFEMPLARYMDDPSGLEVGHGDGGIDPASEEDTGVLRP